MINWESLSHYHHGFRFHYLWFIFPALAGWSIHRFFPAAYVIGPLVATAFMNIIGISLPSIPFLLMVWAQITVGMYMGNSISLSDLKKGGKYGVIYAFVTVFLVAVSFGLGYLLTLVTTLSLQTAMLSVAPGGIVEMTLTATAVGADASVVSSLQLIRVMFIILLVPLFLKWGFTEKKRPLMKTSE
jgi:membrane AbrB-like protein